MNTQTITEKSRWQLTQEMIAKYPEAKAFNEHRDKWSKQRTRLDMLSGKVATAAEKEQAMWAKVQELKAAMPDEAREALCS